MIKKLFLLTTLICNYPLFSQTQFYTTSTTTVGPGVIHKKVHAPTVPWIINVLEIDLQNPYLKMESVKANNRLSGYETTSSMATRSNSAGHRVVGAVNADFYASGGIPIGSQVINGAMLKTSVDWSSIGFDENNKPTIGTIAFSGWASGDSGSFDVANVNATRYTNQLIIYNSYFGGNTGTNEYGTEVSLAPIDSWIVNDTLRLLVTAIETGVGSMSISTGDAILSGHGSAAAFLNNWQTGDTVQLYLGLNPTLPRLTQLVGGNYKFLENGVYTGSTNTDLHPRTFAGINADSTKLLLAVVDGRQPGSIGMNYQHLADYMISLGAVHAVNLDGGGSSTLVVHNVVENSLYTDERTVANALMVVSNAPEDSLIAIQLQPDNFRQFLGSTQSIEVSGWDQYFNPRSVNMANVSFSVSPDGGVIDNAGNFTAPYYSSSGHIVASYLGLTDTAWFYIKTLQSISFVTEHQNTDNIIGLHFPIISIDEDNLPQPIALNEFTWEVLNLAIGYFDSAAVFHGTLEGTTQIVASYLGLTDTTSVTVEIGYGSTVVNSMEVLVNWSVDGVLYDQSATSLSVTDQPLTEGTGAFQLDYQFIRSGAGRSWIHLNNDFPIYGLPDTIKLDFMSNSGLNRDHMLVVVIADNDNELFQTSEVTADTNFTTYNFAMNEFGAVETNATLHFPIRITALKIRMGYYGAIGDTNSGVIYLDNLRVHYPNPLGVSGYSPELPTEFQIFQNYPNPFNSRTSIKYYLPQKTRVNVTIFDLLGRQVVILLNNVQNPGMQSVVWDGRNVAGATVATGLYIYTIELNQNTKSGKMLYLK